MIVDNLTTMFQQHEPKNEMGLPIYVEIGSGEKTVAVYFKVLSRHLFRRPEENHGKL
jgi:hypothetical protein